MRIRLNISLIGLLVIMWCINIYCLIINIDVKNDFINLNNDMIPGALSMARMKFEATEIKQWTLTYILRGNVERSGKLIKDWLTENWEGIEWDAVEHLEHETQIGIEEKAAAEVLLDYSLELVAASREIIALKDQGVASEELFERVRLELGSVFYPLRDKLSSHFEAHNQELANIMSRTHERNVRNSSIIGILGGTATLLGILIVVLINILFRKHRNEQEKTQTFIKNSEQRFRIILENIQAGVVIINEKTSKIQDINKIAVNMIGLSREDIIGKICHDFICPSGNGECPITDSGQIFENSDCVLVNFEGKQIPIIKSVGRFRMNEKDLLIESFVGISDLRKAEEQIEKRQLYLESLLKSAPDAIISTDAENRVVEWNPGAESLFGYTSSEVSGTQLDELITGPDIHKEMESFTELISGGQSLLPVETKRYRKDGSSVFVTTSGSPIVTADGEFIGMVAVYTDNTERKEVEQTLRENEEKFRSIAASAQDGILMMDADGRITFFNNAAERMFGYTTDQVLGKDLHNLLAPENYRKGFQKAFPHFRESGEGMALGRILELEGLRKDGVIFPVEIAISAIQVKGKWHAAGIIRDITERKQIQEELITSREAAESASRTKSEFLSNMSHEIRTPMNAIIGMADLLWETGLTNEQRQYVKVFRNAGENLLNLINDILDISKVEAGKIDLEKISFNLNEVVERICETLAMRAHEKNLELTCRIVPGVPVNFIGDPIRLRQVLVNLIGNAIKFTKKGEIITQVQKFTGSDSEGLLQFSVRDTGIGIPPAKLERIFDSFTQAESSHTRMYGGTGLGLTISKKLTELMGGRMWVESSVGKGSTFYFTALFEVDPNPPEIIDFPDVDIEKLRILIVDDNATNRMILREILEGWGAPVTEMDSGKKVVTELNKAVQTGNPYNLVLLDCMMPGMNGFEVAEKIKDNQDLMDITVMMLSSSFQKGDRIRCMDLGITSSILKPVKKADLQEAIISAVGSTGNDTVDQKTEAAESGAERKPMKILLVDDSEDNRFLVQSYLGETSCDLEIAINGQEAVEKFISESFDIVLMDINMPVMDGYTATRMIREWERETGAEPVPVIALTAYAMKKEVDKCINVGCNTHLSKPIRKARLLETLREYSEGYKKQVKTVAVDIIKVPDSGSVEISTDKIIVRIDSDLEPLIPGYLQNRKQDVKSILDSLENGDYETVQRLGHSMKGSGGGYGFDGISEIGASIEQASKDSDEEKIRECISELKSYVDNIEIVYE